MDRHPIYHDLARGALLFDGATGTYLKAQPGMEQGPVELACLFDPQRVLALHRAYLNAGCRMIKTNTFAAHPGLAAEDETQQQEIVAAAYALARLAAQSSGAYVFADIGPAPAQQDAAQAYIRMADVFLARGADCFLLETMPSPNGLCETARYIRRKNPRAFIAVSFAADPDGFTRAGEHADALIAQMDECEAVDAVGLNCVCGAYHMKRLLAGMKRPKKILMAMPNAGYPHLVDGRMYYDSDPAYFAQQVAGCVSLGAGIIGGCCGTTPAHLAQLARALGERQSGEEKLPHSDRTQERVCHSQILAKLRRGERPILVELDPPRSAQIGGFLDGARMLSVAGADAITIADCPIGRARMDSSLIACKLTRELGIETMPHMTCRDRNVNATKALLLGLAMEGVHNVLAVTGDPVPTSDRGSVKGVFQFHSRVLARFVGSLAESGEAEPFFLCGALNVNAANFEAELEKAKLKEVAGMMAFLTQPILSSRAAENLHRARQTLGGFIFGGLFPVVSHKNAQFMASEVAGVAIEQRVIDAYAGLDREAGEALAQRLCLDAAQRIKQDVDGYYIMTPFSRAELVAEIIRKVKEL